MTHYIIWNKSTAPEIDQEKYVWYNDGVCKIWDGFAWKQVNGGPYGKLDETVIPDTVVFKSDLINIIQRLYSEGAITITNQSDGNYATKSELNEKLNKSDFDNWKSTIATPALNELADHERRISVLETDVNNLKKNGTGNGTSNPEDPNSGGSNTSVGRVWLLYTKTAGPHLIPNKPSPNIKWNTYNNVLTGDLRVYIIGSSERVTWSTDNVNRESGEYVWITMGSFGSNGNLIGEWSDPFCITSGGRDGQDGRNGVDGVNMEFIYKRVTTLEEAFAEDAPKYDVNAPHTNDWHDDANGWYDHPNGIDPEHPIEIVSFRTKLQDSEDWSEFSDPVIWARWGNDGTDGDGVEYIFYIASENEVTPETTAEGTTYHLNSANYPPLSENDLVNGASVDRTTILEDFQNDEWVPGNNKQSVGWDRNWTDDPRDVSSNKPFEFVSIRKWDHDNGTWDYFTEPVLWAKFAYVAVSGFTAFAFTRTSKSIGSYVPVGGSSINPLPEYTKVSANGAVDNDIHWSDSVPSGSEQVWMTTRVFGDGNDNQGWSSPRKLSDTVGFQVEYSDDYPWDTSPRPSLPSLNEARYQGGNDVDNDEDEINETLWRQDCLAQNLGTWSDENVNNPMYMATCIKKSDGWTDWTVSKIQGEAAIGYQWFKIYKISQDTPSVPVGGHWNTVNNTLEQIPEGWSLTNPNTASENVWMAEGKFESVSGTQIGSWVVSKWSANAVSVRSQTSYYKVGGPEETLTTPALDVDPTTVGWTTNPGSLTIDSTHPNLWYFTETEYSTYTYRSPAIIVRYFNSVAQADYQEVAGIVDTVVTGQLNDATKRLGEINSTVTKVTSTGGLTELLNQYCSGNQQSFADFIVNAKESTIKSFAGAKINSELTTAGTTLNGLKGQITSATTRLNGITGTVKAAINDMGTDAITQAVSKSTYLWVNNNDSADVLPYNGEESKSGYTLKTISSEMATIKTTSNNILMAVGNGVTPAASLSVLKELTVDNNHPMLNGQIGSAIILDADHIVLNGEVVANAINAKATNVANGAVQLDANGIHAIAGTIGGFTLGSDHLYSLNKTVVAPQNYNDNGIHIGTDGISLGPVNNNGHSVFEVLPSGALFATNATISGNITSNSLNTGTTSGLNTEIVNGKLSIKDGNKVKAEFGLNNSNELILKFYPPQGKYDAVNNPNGSVTAQYDLGPDGLKDVATVFSPNWTAMIGTKMSGNTVANWFSGSGDLFNHWGVVLENGTMKSTYGTDQTSSFIFNPTTLQLYKYEDGYWQIGNNNNTRQYINPLSNDPRLINNPSSINGNYFKSVGEFPLSQTWLGNNRPDSGYYYIGKGKPISGGTSPGVWPYFISNRFEADYVYYNNQTYTTGKLTYDFCTQFSGSDTQNCTIDFWIEYVSRT